MSRVIVKNLPKKITEGRLREIFSFDGEITDIRMVKTPGGQFRRFAFVGYKTEKQAETAVKFFNQSFIDTSKLEVEIAKTFGDPDLPRPWSKYSRGSSAFEKRQTARNVEEKVDKKENAHKHHRLDLLREQSKSYQLLKKLYEVEEDPQFQEFLQTLKPKSIRARWADDAVPTNLHDAVDRQERLRVRPSFETVPSKKPGGESVVYTRSHLKFESESEDEQSNTEEDHENDALPDVKQDSAVSDMEYLKSKVVRLEDDAKTNETEAAHDSDHSDSDSRGNNDLVDDSIVVSDVVSSSYTLKMRGLPFGASENDIHDFFAPISVTEIRLIANHEGKPSGRAFVDFSSYDDLQKALKRDKDYMDGRYIELFVDDGSTRNRPERATEPDNRPEPSWIAKAATLPGEEESIAESGRLFIRNLSYMCTEDDLQKLFSKYGLLSEVLMPLDHTTKKPKGIAFVTFLMPEHAVVAFNELDRQIFQGRLMHILPARTPFTRSVVQNSDDNEKTFKDKKEDKFKSSSQSSYNWNTLFLGANAVAEAIAAKYQTHKSTILDREVSQSLAVRMALGETQIVQETKKFLEEHGVQLSLFDQMVKERSKTVILVKNLPFSTCETELRDTFSKYGDLGRVVLPPAGITALVEFLEASEARKAFTTLAYTKFKDIPLYLEWAPLQSFSTSYQQVNNHMEDQAAELSDSDDENNAVEGGHQCTLFVKNINFNTTDDKLKEVFSKFGSLRSAVIAKKQDVRKPGQFLSMGYGFVEFKTEKSAKEALKKLQGCFVDGHSLELKFSHRTSKALEGVSSKKSRKRKKTSAKLLVRNVPFEATIKELRQILGSFGEIKTLRLPRKAGGSRSGHRGFAFVEYLSKEEAKRAMKSLAVSTHLYGRRLVLEFADEDDTVDSLRKKTAEHFHGTAEKKPKLFGGADHTKDD